MSELKAFDVGLGRNLEDGSPCVVAFDADQNPRLLNEKVYLKDEVDKVLAKKDKEILRLTEDWNRLCEKYNKFIKLKQEFCDKFKDIELEITK